MTGTLPGPDELPAYDEFLPEDDGLHPHGTHPWSAETWWFSFFVPERGLGGWLYGLARPNQRTSAGGAWIWGPRGSEPRTACYFAHFTALPTRRERLTGNPVTFPSSLEITALRPAMDYRLTYTDQAAGLAVDVDFRATMRAVGHKHSEPPFYESAHFDQAGRVTGTVTLAREVHDVDCFALRDRSWGLRSERVAPDFSYCWLANESEAFLVYGTRDGEAVDVTRGFLYRDGVCRPIVAGHRVERREPERHWIEDIEVHAVDDVGRSIDATARAVSRLVHPRPTSANTISLLRWAHDGHVSWGEDQDVWPHLAWQRRFMAPALPDTGR
jgi:hypothetical protein